VGDLKKRLVSALVFGPLIVLLFLFLPSKLFLLFLALVLMTATFEFSSMARTADSIVVTLLAAATFIPLYFAGARALTFYPFWLLFSPAIYLVFRMAHPVSAPSSRSSEIGRSVTVLILAEVFLALPLFSLYSLKELNRFFPLVLLLTIWASDTGAYLLGKSMGRHKLAPLISPKKTYEGLLGALAGAACVTLLFKDRLGLTLPVSIAMGLVIGGLGQLGDILESIAKRVCEVKDSSRLIPGHGGLLDRVDSFLLTAPFMYYYLSGMR
jgi:phosphatidate cytidylyltransferase